MQLASRRLRILFVPDSLYWVTATIAREIARHNLWIEPTICSHQVVRDLLDRGVDLAAGIDLVHFLTPQIANNLLDAFEGRVAATTSIYHVEDEGSVKPEPRSDTIMTICKQWRDYLIDEGADPNKIVLLHMGVDPDVFRPSPPEKRAAIRARYGLPNDAFVVGFNAKKTSDSYGRKGTDVLARAAESLVGNGRNMALMMVGPGWQDLAGRLTQAGVRCVHIPFLMDRENVANFHKCLDAFWVTSRIEGGPVPLIETMSSGVCAITTPVGMAPELVTSGENGFLVPFDDVDAFAQRTAQLARDSALRARMSTAARKTISNGFSWNLTTTSAEQLYSKAIDRFRERCPHAAIAHDPWQPTPGVQSIHKYEFSAIPRRLRRWAAAQEHLYFMRDLLGIGEHGAASRIALQAIQANPLDFSTWEKAGPFSPFGPVLRPVFRASGTGRRIGHRLRKWIGREVTA